ncbi:MAG: hypothetical protein J5732_00850 [Bacteroidaceae bacterium]|nr:hypothetical protein [Bacteroidaceae bacterium]
MKTKEFIELLQVLSEDAEVMMELGGNASYIPIGAPYVRNLGVGGFHQDCVCIGADIKVYSIFSDT